MVLGMADARVHSKDTSYSTMVFVNLQDHFLFMADDETYANTNDRKSMIA